MRKIFAYIPLLMLLFACNSEEDFIGEQELPSKGETIEIPVVIALSDDTGKEMLTRANENKDEVHQPDVPGEADVDKVKLYIFECANTSDISEIKAEEYTYHSDMELTKFVNASNGSVKIKHKGEEISLPVHNGDKVAVGNITLETDKYYVVWAVAYDKGQESLFKINAPENSKLSDLKVELTGNTTPELFVGCLYINEQGEGGKWENLQEFCTSRPLYDFDESTLFFGQLYRSVGRMSVTLTEIPEGIEEISLVSSLFPTTLPAFNGWFIQFAAKPYSYCYPMGYYPELLSTTNQKVATAKVETTAEGGRTATVSSFFFPFNDTTNGSVTTNPVKNRTFLYVEAGDQRYMVRCANTDGEIPTIWTGLYEVLVSQNTFIVPINWDTRISGKFETLKQGNLKIDLSEMGRENIGKLE